MAENALYIHALRKEDFLALTFELRNLQPQGDPPRLLRSDPAAPAFVIVHFPPQHVQEQAFTQSKAHLQAGPVPVAAMLAGESRLAFRLPDELDGLDYSLQALLDWTRLLPELPANALPTGAQPEPYAAPEPALPADTQTAIEFPQGWAVELVLSPDERRACVVFTDQTEAEAAPASLTVETPKSASRREAAAIFPAVALHDD